VKILDSSALLSLIFDEKGSAEIHQSVLEGVAMSAVSVAEIIDVLIQNKWSLEEAKSVIEELNIKILPFAQDESIVAGQIISKSRSTALAIGDVACLATAATNKLAVVTSIPSWKKIKIPGVKITCAV